ncbi:hypothetical protein OW666_19820 [Acinetobacter baumannii]|uniref:hypothetical protein n=1 Tax=Acinetobacter baumannii TaxID=470 RepID=UPI0024DEEE25|nr:hypothetical protein [Acinetobacter baumannii]MDK2131107.1 hypothetical protein [Acinetobacter baumannii]MDK2161801.1 hypothetical protein [Acinetobacter baumannii]MDK2169251.1 hypothetical protein [Acinetobacter baumannii]MDK2252828.1 hypothetical protein [Acinetobacter baumannii]MDK2264044.1 hypothetical protein [Acinetobacter baumannii]
MDNYKIKVKDEAESKEAQELFFELGYGWRDSKKDITNLDVVFIYAKDGVLTAGFNDHNFAEAGHKELTLPQLRDLVVLKRNDVRDATHRDKLDESIYLTSDKVIYYWYGEWCKSAINKSNDYEDYIANSLTPITQPQDPALISGAEALRALADGKEVEYLEVSGKWRDAKFLTANVLLVGDFSIRLKPQTIKVELELPKPFEPKEDCYVYILDDGKTDGYRLYSYEVHGDKGNTFIGTWRTEDEIKQVVEQLRKIRGAS